MQNFGTLRQPLLGKKVRGEKKRRWEKERKFRSHQWWGSLLPSLRTLDPPLGPPSTWAEIFQRTCLQSYLLTSPPTAKNSYPKFRNPKTTFEILREKKLNLKNTPPPPQGHRGSQKTLGLIISFFCDNKPTCKVSELISFYYFWRRKKKNFWEKRYLSKKKWKD